MSAAQGSENAPRRIGVYRLEDEIGSGAMGKVYRATHEVLGKSVALKLVYVEDPSGEVAARFLQEGVAASRVRHPNVVEILDAGEHEGTAYMAMQLLEGETLADCLSRQGRLPQTYAIDLILPVCAALAAAHDAGVLHRDMKPANIFLADVGRGDPEPILLDFGISKILGPVDPELTQNPRFLGSPLYIAPEQADGAPGSPRSDQYSLALSLYEALLGVRPFAKYSSSLIQLLRHVAEGDIRKPRELDASIPDELDAAITKALHINPMSRFGSVREFGAALLPFASQARRTLWQQSFIDAERTMTSANAPVSDSERSSPRVQVSVDSTPHVDPHAAETHLDPGAPPHGQKGRADFLSHSSLFGESPSTFEPAESSISRKDPFSQAPSGRASGAWSDEEQGTHPSFQRATYNPEAPATRPSEPSRGWRRALLAFAALAFSAALFVALRPWSDTPPPKYQVILTVEPPGALIEIDGQRVGSGNFQGSFQRNGTPHRARFTLSGYEPQTVLFRDEGIRETVALLPLKAPPAEKTTTPVTATSPPQPVADTTPPPAEKRPANKKTAPPAPSRPPAVVSGSGEPQPSSDLEPKAVSKNPEESNKPARPVEKKPSIQTGNLDPWAK